MAATALLRLGKLTGRTDYLEAATRTLAATQAAMQRMSAATGQLLIALDLSRGPTHELVLIGGPDAQTNTATLRLLHQTFLPHSLLLPRPQPTTHHQPPPTSLHQPHRPKQPTHSLHLRKFHLSGSHRRPTANRIRIGKTQQITFMKNYFSTGFRRI